MTRLVPMIRALPATTAPACDAASGSDRSALRRERLRDWVIQASGRTSREALKDDTPLLENRIITSLQVMDLILFIETLARKPIDVERLKPGLFRDIDTILRNFLEA